MSTKQLINIGIYTAIYFVIVMACSMLGAISPLFMFIGYGLGIIVNGPVIMVFLAKVRSAVGWLIMGIILALITTLMGGPWYGLIIVPILALVAGVLAQVRDFRSSVFNTLAYAVFSLWYMVPWGPFLLNQDAYIQDVGHRMGAEYVASFQSFVTPYLIYGWGVACLLIGLLGGFLGMKLMAKHFVKAGLTQ